MASSAHNCKWCGQELHAALICQTVWSPDESITFCNRRCIRRYNQRHDYADPVPEEKRHCPTNDEGFTAEALDHVMYDDPALEELLPLLRPCTGSGNAADPSGGGRQRQQAHAHDASRGPETKDGLDDFAAVLRAASARLAECDGQETDERQTEHTGGGGSVLGGDGTSNGAGSGAGDKCGGDGGGNGGGLIGDSGDGGGAD
eukprot:scaffold24339_cov96-Isochrysis_galbana.AAC.1